jgi:hypothetical protein
MPPKRMETRLDKKKMKETEAREEAERADNLKSRGKSNGVIYSHTRLAPGSSKDEANANGGHRTRYKRTRRRSKSTRRRRRKY